MLAVDGKTVRGSAGDEQAARHLLAVIDHRAAVVLGQVDVASKTNEIPMFPLLCNRIDDLADTVITADALRAQKSHAEVGKRHPLSDNRLHWVRDVTFDEDRSQVRTGNGPRAMASLRNLALSVLRIHGATNIAQACPCSRHPDSV